MLGEVAREPGKLLDSAVYDSGPSNKLGSVGDREDDTVDVSSPAPPAAAAEAGDVLAHSSPYIVVPSGLSSDVAMDEYVEVAALDVEA